MCEWGRSECVSGVGVSVSQDGWAQDYSPLIYTCIYIHVHVCESSLAEIFIGQVK